MMYHPSRRGWCLVTQRGTAAKERERGWPALTRVTLAIRNHGYMLTDYMRKHASSKHLADGIYERCFTLVRQYIYSSYHTAIKFRYI